MDELDSCDGDIDALIAQEWTAAAGMLISLLIDHILSKKIFGVTVIGRLIFNSMSTRNMKHKGMKHKGQYSKKGKK